MPGRSPHRQAILESVHLIGNTNTCTCRVISDPFTVLLLICHLLRSTDKGNFGDISSQLPM